LVSDIHINTIQCWFLMLMIVAIILLITKRKAYYAWITCGLMVSFMGMQWHHFNTDVDIAKITVYKVSGHTAIDLIDRGKTFFISDSTLTADTERMRFHVNPNRQISGVQTVIQDKQAFIRETNYGKLISWNGRLILIRTGRNLPEPDHLKVDYLIIANNAVKDLPSFLQKVEATQIILDSSNSFYYSDRIVNNFKSSELIHSVWHHGAFVRII
jgi:competence protein ComEC